MSQSIKNFKKIFAGCGYILWIFFICNSLAYAGDIAPNSFSAGEVVNANKMNENFMALENAVKNNSFKVKANGQIIGHYIGIGWNSFYVLTDKNFIFAINRFGRPPGIRKYFSSPDCTGQGYMNVDEYDGGHITNLYHLNGTEEIYFVYPDAEAVIMEELYIVSLGSCTPYDTSWDPYYVPIYPNDPNITGVQFPYTVPITVER